MRMKKVRAGQRLFEEDDDAESKIDTVHIVLAGKTAIFFQETAQL